MFCLMTSNGIDLFIESSKGSSADLCSKRLKSIIVHYDISKVNVFVGTFRRALDFSNYMWDSMKKLIKTIRKNNNETIHLHKRSKLEKFVSII